MELKGILYELPVRELPVYYESIQWNWKYSGQEYIAGRHRNPYNGIESFSSPTSSNTVANPWIHTMELKVSWIVGFSLPLLPSGIHTMELKGRTSSYPGTRWGLWLGIHTMELKVKYLAGDPLCLLLESIQWNWKGRRGRDPSSAWSSESIQWNWKASS